MNVTKMLRMALRWGLFIAFSSGVALAKSLPQESPSMTISVFNDSGISANIVEQAEKVSSQVFQESGIRVDWVNCSKIADGSEVACRQPAFPQHLQVRIVQRSLNLKNSILGISYLSTDGSGCQVDIFYKGIEELHRETSLDPAIILGYVVAHEIGHLLLGTHSHSARGIMRAHWNMEELVRAKKRLLVFTRLQSQRMTEELSVGMARGKWPVASDTELSPAD